MPYIEPDARVDLDGYINSMINILDDGYWKPGEVNYTFYRILLAWFKFEPRYKTICSIMGTLSNVTQEIYRKKFAAYEDKAEEKNGKIT
jgi:hypothetical protein